ncbi:MAG: FG-GAP repeat protein, partial [Planctomycetes bacterium]|nr:FG-GAP repeat protein [Planctomycetota bacterium]
MRTAGRSTPDEAIWAMSVQAQETDMRHLTPLLAAAASVLSTAPAHADLGDQLFKLLPDDGAAFDWFGSSVAISEETAIVGASQHDDNGSNSGSAYL